MPTPFNLKKAPILPVLIGNVRANMLRDDASSRLLLDIRESRLSPDLGQSPADVCKCKLEAFLSQKPLS
jgi:hypothetical protein